jgi:hypothetical protein
MENKHLPAYPQALCVGPGGDIITSWGQHSDFAGISKREMIAAMALQGLLASGRYVNNSPALFEIATTIADNLLDHLEKTAK